MQDEEHVYVPLAPYFKLSGTMILRAYDVVEYMA